MIDRGVHARVGSSLVIYKHLTAILLRLLACRSDEPSDDELLSLFPASFS